MVAICWPWEVARTDLPRERHDIPVTGTFTPLGYSPIAYPQA